VDHYILLKRPNIFYGISYSVLGWLTSYLSNRTQFVQLNGSCSKSSVVTCGVSQGSVLGPILFLLYTVDVTRLVDAHNLQVHLYADDTQVYGFCDTEGSASFQNAVSACIDDISAWMRSNRLQLNAAKTKVMWCASSQRMHPVPVVPLRVGADKVTPVSSVRNRGVYLDLDADASMTTHISRTAASCFGILRQLRSVQRSLPRHAVVSLVTSLVLTKLDYCKSLLVGLPAKLLNRLQAVINTEARLVCHAMKADHITPVLRDLHSLRIQERIQFMCPCFQVSCSKKVSPLMFDNNFGKCGPIFQILSPMIRVLYVHITKIFTSPAIYCYTTL